MVSFPVHHTHTHTQTQEESKRCSAHRRRRRPRPRRRRQQCETRLSVVQTRTRPFESTFQLLLKQNLPSLAVRAGVANTFEKPNRNSHPPPLVRKPVSSPMHSHFTHTHTPARTDVECAFHPLRTCSDGATPVPLCQSETGRVESFHTRKGDGIVATRRAHTHSLACLQTAVRHHLCMRVYTHIHTHKGT